MTPDDTNLGPTAVGQGQAYEMTEMTASGMRLAPLTLERGGSYETPLGGQGLVGSQGAAGGGNVGGSGVGRCRVAPLPTNGVAVGGVATDGCEWGGEVVVGGGVAFERNGRRACGAPLC